MENVRREMQLNGMLKIQIESEANTHLFLTSDQVPVIPVYFTGTAVILAI